jgi:magnesium transporter
MGGIAGSQTLTLIIRALSREQIKASNISWIFRKELAVGCLHGVTWAVVVGAVTVFWFDSVVLGIVIAVALLFNLLCAAASGVAVPMLLKRIGQDPALAGSVLLTTVTDVVGFFAFLGLASWWMA